MIQIVHKKIKSTLTCQPILFIASGSASETISEAGFDGFAKPVSGSRFRLHITLGSETGFGSVSQIDYALSV